MVKVVVTGANSGLALEVIDALVEGKHEVLALARRVCAYLPGDNIVLILTPCRTPHRSPSRPA